MTARLGGMICRDLHALLQWFSRDSNQSKPSVIGITTVSLMISELGSSFYQHDDPSLSLYALENEFVPLPSTGFENCTHY